MSDSYETRNEVEVDIKDDELRVIQEHVAAEIAERGCATDEELHQEIDHMNSGQLSDQNAIGQMRKSAAGLCLYESSVSVSLIPSIAAKLDAKGLERSYAVITFDTQVDSGQHDDKTLNITYAVEDGIVGFEWPLIRQRNIEDMQQIIDYVLQQGYKLTRRVQNFSEQEYNALSYLRVEEGDIVSLGIRIITELYGLNQDTEIEILVDGFENPELKKAEAAKFIRKLGGQQGFSADVEHVSSVLRMIHGRTRQNKDGDYLEAWAEFKSFSGAVRFTDTVENEFHHTFWIEVPAEPRMRQFAVNLLGVSGINPLTACGFHRVYSSRNNYENWFPIVTDEDFGKLAEFVVGLLHLLYSHQPSYPLETNSFVPCLDIDALPKWDELPEPLQEDYRLFMADFHKAMSQFHTLMEIGPQSLSGSQRQELVEVRTAMENILSVFPSWIEKLKSLLPEREALYSFATDNQTELLESRRALDRLYKTQMLN